MDGAHGQAQGGGQRSAERQTHLKVHVLVTHSAVVGGFDASALHDAPVAWLRAGRHFELRLAGERGDDYFATQHGLSEREPHLHVQVEPVSFEDLERGGSEGAGQTQIL